MKMKTVALLMTLWSLVCISCSEESPPVSRSHKLRESLKNPAEIFIYEGLPHQFFESKQMASELKRKDTTQLGDFPFYTPKKPVKNDVKIKLTQILSSEKSIKPFPGEKLCGGFHPDYAIAWSMNGKERLAMICFGCCEVIFVSGSKQYRYDLQEGAKTSLQKELTQFESKRPQPNLGKRSPRNKNSKQAQSNPGKSVTILGEVTRAGSYPFPDNGNMDIEALIDLAKGVTELGYQKASVITRGGKKFRPNNGMQTLLMPGDVVIIPLNPNIGTFVILTGRITKPGPIGIPIDGKLTLTMAIARAGGLSRMANPKKIQIRRDNRILRANLEKIQSRKAEDILLKVGDIVTILEGGFK